MPTLFRLLFVLGVVFTAGYGALWGIANLVSPQPRLMMEAVALPPAAHGIRSGRSVAEVLDAQASVLVRHGHGRPLR